MKHPKPIPPKAGQESVWDYPRPPRLESVKKTIEVWFADTLIARTNQAYRVLETSHPPVYYLPPQDVAIECLKPVDKRTGCEWKGEGAYYDVVVGDAVARDAAWYYARPRPAFETIKDFPAFYAHKMDRCLVDGVEVEPQPGNFYGGWITPEIVGPFKGIEGSWGW